MNKILIARKFDFQSDEMSQRETTLLNVAKQNYSSIARNENNNNGFNNGAPQEGSHEEL